VKANLSQWALVSLMAVLVTTVCPASVLADTTSAKPSQSNRPIAAAVQSFSSETVRTLPRKTADTRQQSAPSGSSFFQSKKGAVAVGLMVAGAAFTVWSINHDRKPVKSPVR
jgi:hypothetical protein